MPKNVQTSAQLLLISHASKVMLKILQAKFQQYVNWEMYKMDLEKVEEPEIKLPTIGSHKKQESSRKTSTTALLTMPKPLTAYAMLSHFSRVRLSETP